MSSIQRNSLIQHLLFNFDQNLLQSVDRWDLLITVKKKVNNGHES